LSIHFISQKRSKKEELINPNITHFCYVYLVVEANASNQRKLWLILNKPGFIALFEHRLSVYSAYLT